MAWHDLARGIRDDFADTARWGFIGRTAHAHLVVDTTVRPPNVRGRRRLIRRVGWIVPVPLGTA